MPSANLKAIQSPIELALAKIDTTLKKMLNQLTKIAKIIIEEYGIKEIYVDDWNEETVFPVVGIIHAEKSIVEEEPVDKLTEIIGLIYCLCKALDIHPFKYIHTELKVEVEGYA